MNKSHKERRRGNTVLETALVLIPFLAVLFAIIDFSLIVYARNTLQHSVREGVRYAVTYQTAPGLSHDASIKAVVQENAMGFLGGAAGLNRIRIQYYTPDTFQVTPSNTPGNLVEVSIQGFQWTWVLPLVSSTNAMPISVVAMDRMEGLPAGQFPPAR